MASTDPSSDIYAETLEVFGRARGTHEPLTTPEVAEALDCQRRTAYKRLRTLVERDDLETKKVGASARVWWRPQDESTSLTDSSDRTRADDDALSQNAHATRDARVLLERVCDAFLTLDTDWRITYINESAEAVFDAPADELLGTNLWELFPEANETSFYEHYHEAMAEGESRTIEEYFEPWDRWYREHLYPSESGLSIAFRDVTDRKQRERELEAYQTLTEAAHDVVVTIDEHSMIQTINPAVEDVFGYTPEELEGESLTRLIPDELAQRHEKALARYLETGERTLDWDYVELTGEHVDGTQFPLAVSFSEVEFEGERYFTGIIRDNTRPRQRERELREAKSQLEAAIEAGAVGTWEWRIDEDTFVAGPTLARTFGIDPNAARDGVSIEQCISSIHEADRERIREEIETTVDECGEYEEEYRVWNADDERRWVLARGHVECDDEGTPITFPGVVADITERKRTERELQRHQAFLEESTDIVTVLDRDGTIKYASPSIERILGYDPGEVVGTHGFDLVHPDDREDLWETFATLVHGDADGPLHAEGRLQTADGEWRWLEIRGSNQLDNPTIEGVVANSRDVTERKIQQEKRRLTIDRMTDAIVELDENWQFTVVNERAEEIYGVDAEEILGENVWEVFPDAVDTRFYEEYHRVMATGEPTTFDEYYEGLDTWFQVHVYPSVDGGLSVYFRDITERKQREQELKRRHTELAQLNQFNELVQELVHVVVTETTPAEIEQTICDQLVAADFYHAAWIGERSPTSETVVHSVWSGIDFDASTAAAGRSSDSLPQKLAERALETRDVCVANGIDDPIVSACREQLQAADVESTLAVPIEYEDACYGVLVVYADRSAAFGDRQQTSFANLGDTIGFAIAAAKRKDALVADGIVEITLDIRDTDQFFIQAATRLHATVELEGIARQRDGAYLAYFTVTNASSDELRRLAEQSETIDQIRILSDQEARRLCEVGMAESSIITLVAEYGGTVTGIAAEQDLGTVSVELPQTTDLNAVIDALDASLDDVELQTKRVVDRPMQTDYRFKSAVIDRLTNKQRDALEAAYLAGYFEHPRLSTGQEVAEALGISSSTFHQHLQVGLRKLLAVVVETTAHRGG